MLECLGLSAVRGKEGAGFYERWVFMRVSKIVFGNTVWFSFKWLFATSSENSLRNYSLCTLHYLPSPI